MLPLRHQPWTGSGAGALRSWREAPRLRRAVRHGVAPRRVPRRRSTRRSRRSRTWIARAATSSRAELGSSPSRRAGPDGRFHRVGERIACEVGDAAMSPAAGTHRVGGASSSRRLAGISSLQAGEDVNDPAGCKSDPERRAALSAATTVPRATRAERRGRLSATGRTTCFEGRWSPHRPRRQ